MYRRIFLFPLTLVTLASSSLFANAGEISKEAQTPVETPAYNPYTVGLEASTLGFGGLLAWRFTELFEVRTGINYFEYSDNDTIKGVKLNGSLQMLSEPVTLDIYPWKGNSFHFGVGLLANQNMIFGNAEANSDHTYKINGTRYNGADVGRLNVEINQNPVAPYLGFGGNLFYFDSAHHWALNGELGVAYMGEASVNIGRSGGAAHDTSLGSRIDHSVNQESHSIKNYGNYFQWWPVARLGVNYGF